MISRACLNPDTSVDHLSQMEFPTFGRNTQVQRQGVYVCMTAEIVNMHITIKP